MDTYTCAACGDTFTKGWTDEEMEIEARIHGFDLSASDNVLVCDDCFVPIMQANDHEIGGPRGPR